MNQDYRLQKITENGEIKYSVVYTDEYGKKQIVELSKEANDVIYDLQKSESSYGRKQRRYGVCSLNDDIAICDVSNEDSELDAELFQKLHIAINELTVTQRKRIDFYFYQNLTYEETAKKENVNINAVKESISLAIKKLQIIKKNLD